MHASFLNKHKSICYINLTLNICGSVMIHFLTDRLFETLPVKKIEFLEAWKVHNDALLLYACVHGNVETVAAIMNLNSSALIHSFLPIVLVCM